MTKAAFPSLLRQDPRYYRMGTGGLPQRALYAASRVFVTRTDSGKKQFNFSELFGRATAAAISNAYHPAGDRTLRKNLNFWWMNIAGDAAAYEVKEFCPDLKRKLHKPQPSGSVSRYATIRELSDFALPCGVRGDLFAQSWIDIDLSPRLPARFQVGGERRSQCVAGT
jgi:hypothetical protein